MNQGAQSTVVNHKGRSILKPKLSLTTRVANNSQKKIETLNRIDDVTLKSMYRFYDLEMVICEAGFKKDSSILKRQITGYQNSLRDLRKVREQSAEQRTFLTDARLYSPERRIQQPEKVPTKSKHGGFANCDPDMIGSVRRKTKQIYANSVTKSLSDLQKLREKHEAEHRASLTQLRSLQQQYSIPFDVNIPSRTLDPVSAHTPFLPIIVSLRNKIRYTENELKKLKDRCQKLSVNYYRPKTTGDESENDDEEEQEEEMNKKHKELVKDTFKLFCEKKSRELNVNEREHSRLLSRPTTKQQSKKCRQIRTVQFDLEKMKSEAKISLPMMNLLTASSKNNCIDIIDHPFATGEVAESTISQLLTQVTKDSTMYIWLGYNTAQELQDVLNHNPSKLKQIPAALLAAIEGSNTG